MMSARALCAVLALAGSLAALATLAGAATAQTFTPALDPDRITVEAGGPARTVTVRTAADPGFALDVTYSFEGFPTGIATGGSRTVTSPYPPVTFGFTAAAGTPPGTYTGRLVGEDSRGGRQELPMTVVVARPDFALDVQPRTVTLRPGESTTIRVSNTPIDGFDETVQVSAPTVAGVAFSPARFSLPAGGFRTVTVTADPAAAPGARSAEFQATAPGVAGTRTASLTVQVEPPPDFSLAVAPTSLELRPGESTTVAVSSSATDGFDGAVQVSAPSVAGVAFSPAAFSLSAGGTRAVTVTADPAAAPGVRSAVFQATAAGVAGTRTAALQVRVLPPPDFSLAVDPPTLKLRIGESAAVTVSNAPVDGFDGIVEVDAPAIPGVRFAPARLTLPAGGAGQVVVTAEPSANPGGFAAVFQATGTGVAGPRSATLALSLRSPPPRIDAVSPPSVATDTRENRLRLSGENFQVGATVTAASAGVVVRSARVLDGSTAEVVVAVGPDAEAGEHRLHLTNPHGGRTPRGAPLLVYRGGALGAPLGVTAARIVYPRPWALLELDEPVHARGILATRGMGTVVGAWHLDGVPFDRFVRVVSGGFPVEVETTVPIPVAHAGEHRLELVIESPGTIAPVGVPFLLGVESRSGLRILSPEADALPGEMSSVLRWSLVPGASGYEVEMEPLVDEDSDAAPVRLRFRVSRSEWEPPEAAFRELGPGPVRFRVRPVFPGEVRGSPTPWRTMTPVFGVASDRGSSPGRSSPTGLLRAPHPSPFGGAPGSVLPPTGPPGSEWGLTVLGTTTAMDSEGETPPPHTRAQISTQFDARGETFDAKATADLAVRQDLEDPWDTDEQSRNWLARIGAQRGEYRQEARIGFAPPSFLNGSELLMAGFGGGSAHASLFSPGGAVHYYRSMDLPDGGSSAAFPEPDVRALAYEAPAGDGRYAFRAVALDVEEAESEFSPGGSGEAFGVVGSASLGERLSLTAEGAFGRFERPDESAADRREGYAFLLGLQGAAGRFDYGLRLGRTDADFVNPANPGFTTGGVADRTMAALTLGTALGRASLRGRYERVLDAGSGAADASQDRATLSVDAPLGDRVSVSASGDLALQRADADPDAGLPRTDRGQAGLAVQLSETLGRFSLQQGVQVQRVRDDVQPHTEQTVTSATLAGSGSIGGIFTASANLSADRVRGPPEAGTTDRLLLSVQPRLALESWWITITPHASISKASNDVQELDSTSEQYRLLFQWSPPWAGSLIDLQYSLDWNRTRHGTDPDPAGYDHEGVLTLTLHWGRPRPMGP